MKLSTGKINLQHIEIVIHFLKQKPSFYKTKIRTLNYYFNKDKIFGIWKIYEIKFIGKVKVYVRTAGRANIYGLCGLKMSLKVYNFYSLFFFYLA